MGSSQKKKNEKKKDFQVCVVQFSENVEPILTRDYRKRSSRSAKRDLELQISPIQVSSQNVCTSLGNFQLSIQVSNIVELQLLS